jgi:DNA-binding NtrC family response regulator
MKELKTIIKNTLMLDNEELNSTNLVNIFHENGLNLEIISTQCDYLNRMKQQKYQCMMIHSDLQDNMTYKVIENIKSNYPWIIVIVLLVNISYEKVFEFVRLGVDDFIVKPFSWEDIESVYKHYYY